MKTKLFLKTLLVAVCLLVGSNGAWADGSKRVLNSQNYESAVSADWTSPDGTVTLVTGDATYGKYAQCTSSSGSGNRSSYKSVSFAFSTGTGYTTSGVTTAGYNIELDFSLTGGNVVKRSVSQFIVPTTGPNLATNKTYTGTDYIFALTQPELAQEGVNASIEAGKTGTALTTWYINDLTNATDKTVELSDGIWYHLKLVVSASSVAYTITNKSTSAEVATGSKVVTSMPTITGFFDLLGRGSGKLKFDNLDIYDYTESETVTAPSMSVAYAGANRTVTIVDGISSEDNEVTTYYTTDGSDPTSESVEYTEALTITENCTVKAISISSTGVSSTVSSLAVTVGKLSLATPTINATGFSNVNGIYIKNPTFNFTCDNSKIEGAPTATLSYTFTPVGGSESSPVNGTSFTPTTKGTLKVIASADNYNSSEKTLVISNGYTVTYTGKDYTSMTTEDITGVTWGDSYSVAWTGWKEGLTANILQGFDGSNFTNNHFLIQNANTIYLVQGWGWVRNDASYGYAVRHSKEGDFIALKENTSKGNDASATTYQSVYCSSGTGAITNYERIYVPATYAVQQLYHYSPADMVDIAIADCKVYETSSTFATYIDGKKAAGDFSTAEDVYAAHTAWQVAQAKASGSTNLTKLIRNAAVVDGSDWGASSINHGEQYTGAPDEYYIDKYNGTINTNQTIYGVPAGTYKIKAATRSAVGTEGTLYANDGTSDVGKVNQITSVGNTGGDLGNGWSWSEMTFTLTETKNLLIGFWADASSSKWAGCDNWHMELVGVTGTIPSSGFGTIASAYALDLDKVTVSDGTLTAYKVNEITKDYAKLAIVGGSVAAATGLILEGKPGATCTIPVAESGTDISSTNKLQAAVNATEVAENDAYILKSGKFHKVTTASTIPAGKAYLLADDVPVEARTLSFFFEDDETTTGIADVRSETSDVRGGFFDLQGRKINGQLPKGLYIVNGKKVVIK